MILNVSGRTDIVAFYTPWFMKRYEEGFVDVRNPFFQRQVSRIYFEDIDAIVFCTKNPIPIVKHIKKIDKPIVFQITLTPYDKEIEPNVPPKGQIIRAIQTLSKHLGKENIYVRYDPIFISEKYSIEYHTKMFARMCTLLDGYTSHIIVSFLDNYKNVERNLNVLHPKVITEEGYKEIGTSFSRSAKKHNMTVQTCAEEHNLVEYGFRKEDCISPTLAYKLTGKTNFKYWKARNRNTCKCVEMVDIGVYNSCKHFCKYCYANYDENKVQDTYKNHNINSSILIGDIGKEDIIKIRK